MSACDGLKGPARQLIEGRWDGTCEAIAEDWIRSASTPAYASLAESMQLVHMCACIRERRISVLRQLFTMPSYPAFAGRGMARSGHPLSEKYSFLAEYASSQKNPEAREVIYQAARERAQSMVASDALDTYIMLIKTAGTDEAESILEGCDVVIRGESIELFRRVTNQLSYDLDPKEFVGIVCRLMGFLLSNSTRKKKDTPALFSRAVYRIQFYGSEKYREVNPVSVKCFMRHSVVNEILRDDADALLQYIQSGTPNTEVVPTLLDNLGCARIASRWEVEGRQLPDSLLRIALRGARLRQLKRRIRMIGRISLVVRRYREDFYDPFKEGGFMAVTAPEYADIMRG